MLGLGLFFSPCHVIILKYSFAMASLDNSKTNDDESHSVTSVKLNGFNYHAWSHAFKVFLRAKKAMKYIVDDSPKDEDKNSEEWWSENSTVMTWLWCSMEPSIIPNVQYG